MKLQPTVIRPCGNMEKYSTARHALGLYRCVSVAGRYAVPLGTGDQGLETTFQRAIAQVILEQPFMRVGIIDEDKQTTSFVHVTHIDLSEHIRWFGPSQPDAVDETLCKHLSFQHDQVFQEIDRRPPWMVAVIPIQKQHGPSEFEVVYSVHHAISDGTSCSIFHTRLLEALRNPAKDLPGLTAKILELPVPPVLPPPQDQMVKGQISWSMFLWTLWDAFGPSWLKSEPEVVPWKGSRIDFSLPCQTSTRILRVPAPTAAKLLAAARAHSTTLTPLIQALIAASLSRRLPFPEAPAFKPCSPISMRRYVPAAANFDTKTQMLVLVSSAEHPMSKSQTAKLRESSGPAQEDAIWEVAASVKASLNEKVASLPDDDVSAMLKYVSDFHDFFQKKNGGERSNSWELSNLGAIDGGSDDGNWRLTRAVFSQPANAVGPGFAVNMAGIAGGEVTVTLSWSASFVDTTTIDGLAIDLESWIQKIGDGIPL